MTSETYVWKNTAGFVRFFRNSRIHIEVPPCMACPPDGHKVGTVRYICLDINSLYPTTRCTVSCVSKSLTRLEVDREREKSE